MLDLPGRSLRFKAIAGAIRLSDAQSGEPQADVAYVAFLLEGPTPPSDQSLSRSMAVPARLRHGSISAPWDRGG